MASGQRIAVWLKPEQREFVGAVAQEAGCVVTHAGTPTVGRSGEVAGVLCAAAFDDLRAATATLDVDALWLACAPGLGDERAEQRLLAERSERGLRCVSTEPFPASAMALASGAGGIDEQPWPRQLGMLRATPAWTRAAEAVREFGPVRMLLAQAFVPPEASSLGAGLVSLLDLVSSVMLEAETIDAVYVGPRAASGLHAAPPETLRDLHGDMAATLRFAGASAVIAASNTSHRWSFSITLISERGRLHITERDWEWLSSDGTVVDKFKPAKKKAPGTAADPAIDIFAESLRVTLQHRREPHAEAAHILVHAALLSARTGQPESPDTIRRLAGL